LFRFLTTTHDHEDDDDDDQEEPEEEQETHDSADQPHRYARLLTPFSLRLLTALDQPVDF
jgi:TATA-binding protein-associated factor Taf7